MTEHNGTFEVDYMVHKDTGLLMAISDNMPGLMVTARTILELDRRVPAAIEAILHAQGNENARVRASSSTSDLADFEKRRATFTLDQAA